MKLTERTAVRLLTAVADHDAADEIERVFNTTEKVANLADVVVGTPIVADLPVGIDFDSKADQAALGTALLALSMRLDAIETALADLLTALKS